MEPQMRWVLPILSLSTLISIYIFGWCAVVPSKRSIFLAVSMLPSAVLCIVAAYMKNETSYAVQIGFLVVAAYVDIQRKFTNGQRLRLHASELELFYSVLVVTACEASGGTNIPVKSQQRVAYLTHGFVCCALDCIIHHSPHPLRWARLTHGRYCGGFMWPLHWTNIVYRN